MSENNLVLNQNKSFDYLYKNYFSMIKIFILKNNGREEDAEDIFQDTMIILFEKLKKDDFLVSASLKTYIYAIAKNLWFKKLNFSRKYNQVEFYDNFNESFFNHLDEIIENEKDYLDKLYYALKKITNHCLTLIENIFFNEKSIGEIQKEFGYTTKHNAQNQKYKCVKQLKEAMKEEV